MGSASNYTAQYDASGNMSCRATGGTTCGSTAAVLSYDNEGRLTAWQNHALNPTSTDSFLYDGEGNRVAQQSASGGITTQSVYVGDLVDVRTVTGAPSPGNITYYSASGKRIALMNQGTLSYLVGDHLGSTVETLDSLGNVQGSQLYGPYGSSRYSTGSMGTDYGFTGQRADSTTGLDYYNARYYDPAVGQFGSADSMLDGQNRFGYVGGNPTTYTDPSGHVLCDPDNCSKELPGPSGGGFGDPIGVAIGTAIAQAGIWLADATYCAIYGCVTQDPQGTAAASAAAAAFVAAADTATSDPTLYFKYGNDRKERPVQQISATITCYSNCLGEGSPGVEPEPAPEPSTAGGTAGMPPVCDGGNRFIADTGLFLDAVPPGQRKLIDQRYLNNPNITLYITEGVIGQVLDPIWGTLEQAMRLLRGDGAKLIAIPNGDLTGLDPSLLGGKFDLVDAGMVQAAVERNLPVVTLNKKLKGQVTDNKDRKAAYPQWAGVTFIDPCK